MGFFLLDALLAFCVYYFLKMLRALNKVASFLLLTSLPLKNLHASDFEALSFCATLNRPGAARFRSARWSASRPYVSVPTETPSSVQAFIEPSTEHEMSLGGSAVTVIQVTAASCAFHLPTYRTPIHSGWGILSTA